ncbi:MAG: chromosome segregation protein SMC, partial [Alteromonadaceae bacterium]
MHLDKIRIKNTRRFADEVNVDFGEGATIILAPNGTGKTTIFEAIELALTGKIDRLKDDAQEAVIRDKADQASVRLDFSGGECCQAIYDRGASCSLSGDHENIFSLDKKESLPYLLRLTHYLEQRGKQ